MGHDQDPLELAKERIHRVLLTCGQLIEELGLALQAVRQAQADQARGDPMPIRVENDPAVTEAIDRSAKLWTRTPPGLRDRRHTDQRWRDYEGDEDAFRLASLDDDIGGVPV